MKGHGEGYPCDDAVANGYHSKWATDMVGLHVSFLPPHTQ